MPSGGFGSFNIFGAGGGANAARREIRASDAEREEVVNVLREQAGEGRISVEELSERVGHAYSARTLADLDVLVCDLPVPVARPAPLPSTLNPVPVRWRRRRSLPLQALRLVIVNIAFLAIWFATGHSGRSADFWPIWPLVLSAVFLALRALKTFERRPSCRGDNRLAPGPTRRYPWR